MSICSSVMYKVQDSYCSFQMFKTSEPLYNSELVLNIWKLQTESCTLSGKLHTTDKQIDIFQLKALFLSHVSSVFNLIHADLAFSRKGFCPRLSHGLLKNVTEGLLVFNPVIFHMKWCSISSMKDNFFGRFSSFALFEVNVPIWVMYCLLFFMEFSTFM